MDEKVLIGEKHSFYNRADLIYEYRWPEYLKDDPKVSGVPDQTDFNRTFGPEVLYLINAFAASRNFKNRHSGVKVEKLINVYVPQEITAQDKVLEWIEAHWFNFL